MGAPMKWTLHLPIDLPSANAHIVNGRDRRVGAIYAKLRNGWAAALKMEALAQGVPLATSRAIWEGGLRLEPVTVVGFRTVEIVRLMSAKQREMDDDGLSGGAKGFRDAMQAERVHRGKLVPGAGIVRDDSKRWSRWIYAQERATDGRPGVRVTITEGAAP